MSRKRRSGLRSAGRECRAGECLHGGRCVRTSAGAACACAGAWGGARCALYVGHDHACAGGAGGRCAPPAICVWGPDVSASEAGPVMCACLEGASCSPPAPDPALGVGAGSAGAAHAWMVASLTVLTIATLVVFLGMFILYKRRQRAFPHARLPDNVEICNPMYLAGEDEAAPDRANGGNHFANPVYESMYAPEQNNPTEEQATLLTPERAALLQSAA